MQLHLEEVQVQLATQQQSFKVELATQKRIKKELKIERDQLLGNIKLMQKVNEKQSIVICIVSIR